MNPTNRRERRAQASRQRRAERRSASVTILSLRLAGAANKGKTSRRQAKRLLVREVERRYGRFHARLMSPRLFKLAPPAS